MSARSSRLHALEMSVKAPAKRRKKARAFSVMRFEGADVTGTTGATAAPPPAVQPAGTRRTRLPKDMEEQIAIVRGRAVGKPSRGLLQLEQRLLRPREIGPTSPTIQRHDHGAVPISATPAATPVSQARALSRPMAAAASEFGGRFNVESFEDTSATGVPGQILPTPANGNYAGATPSIAPAPVVSAAPAPPASPCAETHPDPSARNAERDRGPRRTTLTPDQEAIAASFDRDIAAMLGTPAPASTPENKQWDDAIRNAATPTPPAAPAPGAPAAPAAGTPAPAPGSTEPPKQNGHEVFNQMGLAMNYANSFDLGAMDLSARFDRFDEELALAPKSTPLSAASSSSGFRSPVQALALDDFDLVEDLAEISTAQSTKPEEPTGVAQPTPSPEAPKTVAQPTPSPEAPTAVAQPTPSLKDPKAIAQPTPSPEAPTAVAQPSPSPEPAPPTSHIYETSS